MKYYLCIDIDNGAFRYAVISEELDILVEKRRIVSVESKEELFGAIQEVADQYHDQVEALSITMPGVIDRYKGIAYSGGVYTWVRNMPYAEELESLVHLPVVICNDAKAAALAEVGYGSLKGIAHGFMLMILGGGIGGAVVSYGHLIEGAHYAAGEFSYIHGDYRKTGNDSMFAYTNNIQALSKCVEEETGIPDMNIMKIMMKLNAGEEGVVRGVKKYCDRLAYYIYNIQCVVDASRVVIAGNITDDPIFMATIKEAVKEKFKNQTFQNIWEPEVVESTFHSHARMYGAIYHYHKYLARKESEAL